MKVDFPRPNFNHYSVRVIKGEKNNSINNDKDPAVKYIFIGFVICAELRTEHAGCADVLKIYETS